MTTGGENMASVFDVAKYILEQKGPMTTMKLQKLCYYAQAWSLVWDEEALFDEEIQAWANGPVCPKLYNAHSGLYKVDAKHFPYGDSTVFTEDQVDTLKAVLEYYGDRAASWLIQLSHNEDPWKLARGDTRTGDPCNTDITWSSMAEFYSSLDKEDE